MADKDSSKADDLLQKAFMSFLQPAHLREQKDPSEYICDITGKTEDLYGDLLAERKKRKYPGKEYHLFKRDDSTMMAQWVTIIHLYQDKDSSFILAAWCHGEESKDKLFEFKKIFGPKKFVECFNQISLKIKCKPLLHYLPGLGELDPQFAAILFDFLTRDPGEEKPLQIRTFFGLWGKRFLQLSANWADPESPVYGRFEKQYRVKDFKGEPGYAIFQICMEAAIEDGANPNDPATQKLAMKGMKKFAVL
jgi:hypothetical protein